MNNSISPKISIEEVKAKAARKKLGDFAYGLIFAKSAGRCQFCNKLLYEHHLTTEDCNLAELAHIVAFKAAGPRGDEAKSVFLDGKECNFLLLCHDCHRLIDHEGKYVYTEEQLITLKRTKEDEIRKVTETVASVKTNCIAYTAKIGEYMPSISNQEVRKAVIDDHMYPANHEPINMKSTDLGIGDNEEAFWNVEATRLCNLFRKMVYNGSEGAREIQNYSVFALAPQPLLVKLGSLLENKTTIHIFQRHREPEETWSWPRSDYQDKLYISEPDRMAVGAPVLIFAISAKAIVNCVRNQLKDISDNIWIVEASSPNYNWCANKAQQQQFRDTSRRILDAIRLRNAGEEIHVYMAMPNSLAVEFGRVWMSKADAPLLLYDIDRITKRYNKVLKIEN